MNSSAPIYFKFGSIALWHLLTRRVVLGSDPALSLIKTYAPEQFKDIIEAPLPTTMEERYGKA